MVSPIQLGTLEAEVWALLAQSLEDRESPLRTPAVATVGIEGAPQVRTVVLRAVNARARTLEFHTHLRSAKVAEIRRIEPVTWLFYDPQRLLQLRAAAVASLLTHGEAADAAWASNPLASRAHYSSEHPPGTPIDAPPDAVFLRDEQHSAQGRANFCAVRCTVERLDVLQLHPEGHRRAVVRDGVARWVAP